MRINSFFPLQNRYSNDTLRKQNLNNSSFEAKLVKYAYPVNYHLDNFSFKAKLRADEIIAKVGEENFPSLEIVKTLKNLKSSSNFSLYDIHIKHYKALCDCKTLEEAKEKYPEFRDVIDAKDINTSCMLSSDKFVKIANGEIEGANIENLSLELLKRKYGEYKPVNIKENYFGMSPATTLKVFKLLNIKLPDKTYNKIINNCIAWMNDDGSRREKARQDAITTLHTKEVEEKVRTSIRSEESLLKRSIASKEAWDNDDGSRRQAVKSSAAGILHSKEADEKRAATMKTEEYKAECSARIKKSWEDADERRRETSERAKKVFKLPEVIKKQKMSVSTPEHRKKLSLAAKKFYEEHSEYNEARKEAWTRHKEITEKMSAIAREEFKTIGRILEKIDKHIPLKENEKKCLGSYYRRCIDEIPDMHKIIGNEFHNILIEKGMLKEEG